MNNILLHDYLSHHNIYYFHVCIVDFICVGKDNKLHLYKQIKDHKFIWELVFITPCSLKQDDGFAVKSKVVEIG